MVLLIDVGNSNIVVGLYNEEQLTKTFRIKAFDNKTSDEYYVLFKGILGDITICDAIISSVVPIITSALNKMLQTYYSVESLILGIGVKTGIMVKADDPKGVGSDLICDVAGAMLYHDEMLIIDLGTATKFIYAKNSTMLGVSIAPGVVISMKALISNAALLPNIELVTPKKVLGNSTIPCMQSGVIYGAASMVSGMIKLIKDEINNQELKIVATGGLAKIIIPLCNESIIIDENLVLNGLISIYKKNRDL